MFALRQKSPETFDQMRRLYIILSLFLLISRSFWSCYSHNKRWWSQSDTAWSFRRASHFGRYDSKRNNQLWWSNIYVQRRVRQMAWWLFWKRYTQFGSNYGRSKFIFQFTVLIFLESEINRKSNSTPNSFVALCITDWSGQHHFDVSHLF